MADPNYRVFTHTSGGPGGTSWSHWRVCGDSNNGTTFIQVLDNGDVAICGSVGVEDTSGDVYIGAIVLDADTGEVKEFCAADDAAFSAAQDYASTDNLIGGTHFTDVMVAGKPGRNCVNPEDNRHIVWRFSDPGSPGSTFACVDLDDAFYVKDAIRTSSSETQWQSVVLPTNWTTPTTFVDGCVHLFADTSEYGFYYADFLNANWSTTGTAFTGGAGAVTKDEHKVTCSDDRMYIWHGDNIGGDQLTEYSGIDADLELTIFGVNLNGSGTCQSTSTNDCDFKFFPKRNELMLCGEAAADATVTFYDPTLTATAGIGALAVEGTDYLENVRACEISDTEFIFSFGDANADIYIGDVDTSDSTDLAAGVGSFQFLRLRNGLGAQRDTDRFAMNSSIDGKFVYIFQGDEGNEDLMVIHKIAWADWGTIDISNAYFEFSPSTSPQTPVNKSVSSNSTGTGATSYSIGSATDATEDSDSFLTEPTWDKTPQVIVH